MLAARPWRSAQAGWERTAICDAATLANYRACRPFSGARAGGQVEPCRSPVHASDATPEIAGSREKYDIGGTDRAVIDASGRPGRLGSNTKPGSLIERRLGPNSAEQQCRNP